MRYRATIKLLGILLMMFSLSMLTPVFVSLYYKDGASLAFLVAFFVTFLTGFMVWYPLSKQNYELKTRDGFLVVTLFWFVLTLFGAIPLVINQYANLSFTNAVFESVSGLTTTGATMLSNLSLLPKSILYYRQQLHLLGGMGIVVLAVAILPMLGVGGMQLYRAETVGPFKTSKLKPRMTETAKALWYIYVGLVVLCALAYWACGMTLFDAIGESYSTISTGGFSTHDSSFAFYHSPLICCVSIVFMLLSGTNFALHYHFFRVRSVSAYTGDTEWRAYVKSLLVVSIIICALLAYHLSFGDWAYLNVVFTVVSLATTTGLTTVDYSLWPISIPFLLMFIAMIGGCGGSTSGGVKVSRCLLVKAQGVRELNQLVHPRAIIPLQQGNQVFSNKVIQSIWSFASVYIILFALFFLLLIIDGLDPVTAFGAVAACISNTGASIGEVAHTFVHIPLLSKWILIMCMLLGRLEIFTLLVLFTPAYWKR